jgi:hypothetical protein
VGVGNCDVEEGLGMLGIEASKEAYIDVVGAMNESLETFVRSYSII